MLLFGYEDTAFFDGIEISMFNMLSNSQLWSALQQRQYRKIQITGEVPATNTRRKVSTLLICLNLHA